MVLLVLLLSGCGLTVSVLLFDVETAGGENERRNSTALFPLQEQFSMAACLSTMSRLTSRHSGIQSNRGKKILAFLSTDLNKASDLD